MSKTYSIKPELPRKVRGRNQRDKNVVLADYDLHFIEESVGHPVRF